MMMISAAETNQWALSGKLIKGLGTNFGSFAIVAMPARAVPRAFNSQGFGKRNVEGSSALWRPVYVYRFHLRPSNEP